MAPNDSFSGTYVRMEFAEGKGRDVMGRVAEYITLTDGFNFIGLKRSLK